MATKLSMTYFWIIAIVMVLVLAGVGYAIGRYTSVSNDNSRCYMFAGIGAIVGVVGSGILWYTMVRSPTPETDAKKNAVAQTVDINLDGEDTSNTTPEMYISAMKDDIASL